MSEEFFRKDGSLKRRREVRWERQRNKRRAGFTELCLTILVAFVLVFGVVRPFVLEAFRIPSESMVPTLEVGDRVFVNKFIYRFAEPERKAERDDRFLTDARVRLVVVRELEERRDGLLVLEVAEDDAALLMGATPGRRKAQGAPAVGPCPP